MYILNILLDTIRNEGFLQNLVGLSIPISICTHNGWEDGRMRGNSRARARVIERETCRASASTRARTRENARASMARDPGWRRLIGSPKLQIIFHKRATKYRSLLR